MNRLEERVTEDTVRFRRPIQVTDTVVKDSLVDESRPDSRIANAFDHGGERFLRKTIDKFRPTGIDIDHSRRNPDRAVTGLVQERIQFPSDQGVAAGAFLQFDLTLNRLVGGLAVGMEKRRAMVAFDDGDRAAGFQQVFQRSQRLDRLREMFQHETNEDVVERFRFERQPENISLLELNVSQAQRLDLSFGLRNRNVGHINGSDQSLRDCFGQG